MDKLFDLTGRTALVAGAGGLGRGMAAGLASAGADVILADADPAHCALGAKTVAGYGRKSLELTYDIFDRNAINQMVDAAVAFNGRLDILVNSVGISRMGHAHELTFEDWMAVMDAFLNNVFFTCQAVALKAMIPQNYGKIINIASMSGVVITGDSGSPYATAKAGVIHMTKALATEWAKFGINVNSISPGFMLTPLTEGFLGNPEVARGFLGTICKGRFGQPEDLAGAAVFLASDSSEYMVGQNLIIDGGYSAV